MYVCQLIIGYIAKAKKIISIHLCTVMRIMFQYMHIKVATHEYTFLSRDLNKYASMLSQDKCMKSRCSIYIDHDNMSIAGQR